MTAITHWYHIYADGDWKVPVDEHFAALTKSGLYDTLDTLFIGLVGSEANRVAVHDHLVDFRYRTAAEADTGFEQVTLVPMWEWCRDVGEGLVFYAHTKGAANFAPINDPWRRSMTWYNVIMWRDVVAALEDWATIAGCHWIKGNPEIERLVDAWQNRKLNPPGLDGVGGMFGGNYWWTHADKLGHNRAPGGDRMAAEHWLGQLSEIMPICADTIYDMNPRPITPANLRSTW